MSGMNISQVERVEILPLNPPANNSYSFKQGFPIVQFMIPNQPKLLLGASLRLNGVLRVNMPGSTEITPVLPDNNENKGGGDANKNVCLNSRVGIASCIEQITLSSMTNQTLEIVRNYGRYLASAQPITHSQEDLDTNTQLEGMTASRKMNGAFIVNNDVEFSIPLRTGLLTGGNPLPIGTNGLRGMMVQLQLSPDANVLGGWVANDGTVKNDAGTGNGCFYQLRNLSLSYSLLVPDAKGQEMMSVPSSGSFTYNAISHLYSVLNSSDQTQNFNLGTGRTQSIFHNFLPSTHINNYNEDGFATPPLKNATAGIYDTPTTIERVSFLKGGVLFPIENEIDTRVASSQDRPESELISNFINSIKPFKQMNHSLISLNTENNLATQVNVNGISNRSKFVLADQDPIFGVGVAEDPYRVGVDFKGTNYGIRMKTSINGNSPNSVFTYVLATNTLMYSPSGIQVMS